MRNGTVEVLYENKTAQMSALFQAFTCAFFLVELALQLVPNPPLSSSAVLLKLLTIVKGLVHDTNLTSPT